MRPCPSSSVMVQVTIVGAGNMGRGIGRRLAGEKNQLQILAPTVDHATKLAAELGMGRLVAVRTTPSTARSSCWRRRTTELSTSWRSAEAI